MLKKPFGTPETVKLIEANANVSGRDQRETPYPEQQCTCQINRNALLKLYGTEVTKASRLDSLRRLVGRSERTWCCFPPSYPGFLPGSSQVGVM